MQECISIYCQVVLVLASVGNDCKDVMYIKIYETSELAVRC
jgi:hypothetical protein